MISARVESEKLLVIAVPPKMDKGVLETPSQISPLFEFDTSAGGNALLEVTVELPQATTDDRRRDRRKFTRNPHHNVMPGDVE